MNNSAAPVETDAILTILIKMYLRKACREFLIAFSSIRVPQIPRGISVAQAALQADHQKMRRLKGFSVGNFRHTNSA